MHFSTYLTDIRQSNEKASANIILASDRIAEKQNKIMSAGIQTLNKKINDGVMYLDSRMSDLREEINAIQRQHSMALGAMKTQIQMQRKEMREGLLSIENILKNRRKTDALEYFNDGVEAYNNGLRFRNKPVWIKNAFKYFSKSIEQHEMNPFPHFYLGHIYHYNKDFMDIDLAIEQYELCYTYSEASSENNALTAQSYLYAGWLYFAVKEDTDKAIELTKQAIAFDPSLSAAYYNLVLMYSENKDFESSISYLKTLLYDIDHNYYAIFMSDENFNDTREHYSIFLKSIFPELMEKNAKLKNRLEDIIQKAGRKATGISPAITISNLLDSSSGSTRSVDINDEELKIYFQNKEIEKRLKESLPMIEKLNLAYQKEHDSRTLDHLNEVDELLETLNVDRLHLLSQLVDLIAKTYRHDSGIDGHSVSRYWNDPATGIQKEIEHYEK